MKGIEIGSCKRLSEICEENLDKSNVVAVWLGPGHVQDFASGRPNCMVIDSKSDSVKRSLVDEFSSNLIRFYYGTDLVGNEVGAAAKNVIGIAAGILDGLGISSLKGALMARGPREISRLVLAMGGDPVSVYGLCHLGDYEATVFSEFSHNRTFGECFAKGESYDQLAEGYYTAKAMMDLAERYNVELPICSAVYKVLYENVPPKDVLQSLFDRSLKMEF
jgi:glycerol-3-phosphate dehydrogenase (NAD(P)+)